MAPSTNNEEENLTRKMEWGQIHGGMIVCLDRFYTGSFEGFNSTTERKKKEVIIKFQPVSL